MVFLTKIFNDIMQLHPHQKPVQFGNKVLRQEAYEVPLDFLSTKEFSRLLSHMKSVMSMYGGQGLAANQVGIPLQIIIVQFNEHDMEMSTKCFTQKGVEERKMSLIPFHVLVNPKLQIVDFKQDIFDEGCLSLENQKGLVARYQAVKVDALNEHGENVSFIADGWYARILQHEYHHLKGLLITDYFIQPERRKRFKW